MVRRIPADVEYMQTEAPSSSGAPDPLAGQSTDEYGIPVSVVHSPQTNLPVWQFIHKLATPIPDLKSPDRPHTHICVLCAATPPVRVTNKQVLTWRSALMRQRMSTNAVAHMQRVHPDEFVTIADYKQRKREALANRAVNSEKQPKKKRVTRSPSPKTPKPMTVEQQTKENAPEPADAVPVATVVKTSGATGLQRKRATAKTAELVKAWLISSGLPVSVLQDETFQDLLKLSNSGMATLPTVSSLSSQVQEEFARFGSVLGPYLTAESHAAMGLPFLSLYHEFRPITGATAEEGASSDVMPNQEKAFLGVRVGFINSQWRKVDMVLAAKEVPRGWDQQVNQLVNQTVSEMYGIQSISNYARFHVGSEDDLSPTLIADEDYELPTDEQEGTLTNTLRRCVIEALGVGHSSSFGGETNVHRILRLLQELLRYFDAPGRANGLTTIAATNGVQISLHSTSSIDNLVLSSLTSIGAIAELLRISCARYRAYSLYFRSPVRSTVAEPELETAWMQLSMDDWQTVTEIEAILNQLSQFCLEEQIAPREGAVASSYALLFRRLLSVTTNVSSLKCLTLEDDSTLAVSTIKRTARRKAKRVDSFTPAGRVCVVQLREQITQRFTTPSTPSGVDDEIKAMLLDPRISSKVANLVTDARAFRRAQEDLRQEHRVVFELLADRPGDSGSSTEEEDEDEDDNDEISALLMVDGPKNQPPAASSTTSNGKRSSETVVENEARAWREWQQVYVAWDAHANEGADLFDKGQYNLLKLYHHVNILKWFREFGQQAHPAASLLARMYLGQQPPSSRALGASLLHFTKQEAADWIDEAAQRAEKRCVLHHNWHQYQKLRANDALRPASGGDTTTV